MRGNRYSEKSTSGSNDLPNRGRPLGTWSLILKGFLQEFPNRFFSIIIFFFNFYGVTQNLRLFSTCIITMLSVAIYNKKNQRKMFLLPKWYHRITFLTRLMFIKVLPVFQNFMWSSNWPWESVFLLLTVEDCTIVFPYPEYKRQKCGHSFQAYELNYLPP